MRKASARFTLMFYNSEIMNTHNNFKFAVIICVPTLLIETLAYYLILNFHIIKFNQRTNVLVVHKLVIFKLISAPWSWDGGQSSVALLGVLRLGWILELVLAAFIANLGTINTGLVFGFSAVAIPQLEEPTSFIKVDEDQASWIASLSSLSTPFGCLLGGYLMDVIGRKRTLIITEIPLIVGWFLISFSTCVEMIYVGRLLVGLGSGMVGAPARVYTGEVTQPHLRGMLSALASVGVRWEYL
ncbi:hypothetical protein L9F63_027847, partial [Diploptera punctata]